MAEAEQIRQAIGAARVDLEAAEREREALRLQRAAMLTTASVDEIVAVDDKARALTIKVEISQAKITAFGRELDRVERERARWGGVAMPTGAELKQLLALVEREHPRLLDRDPNAYIARNVDDEFKRAFYGVGSITRLSEPTQKIAFSTHVDRLNDLLRRRGHAEVMGDVVMAAVIAWGDSDYRLGDPRYGQLTEASLDPLHNTGRAPSAAWREILAGVAPLRQALPPRGVIRLPAAQPIPKFYQEGGDGRMHEVARN
jgi:hypothetical protein